MNHFATVSNSRVHGRYREGFLIVHDQNVFRLTPHEQARPIATYKNLLGQWLTERLPLPKKKKKNSIGLYPMGKAKNWKSEIGVFAKVNWINITGTFTFTHKHTHTPPVWVTQVLYLLSVLKWSTDVIKFSFQHFSNSWPYFSKHYENPNTPNLTKLVHCGPRWLYKYLISLIKISAN